MPTPHVHAELIKAWADGAEIEYFDRDLDDWEEIKKPTWHQATKYRIKPTPKPKVTRWLWACKFPQDTRWTHTCVFYTEEEFKQWTPAKGIKLEWSALEFEE